MFGFGRQQKEQRIIDEVLDYCENMKAHWDNIFEQFGEEDRNTAEYYVIFGRRRALKNILYDTEAHENLSTLTAICDNWISGYRTYPGKVKDYQDYEDEGTYEIYDDILNIISDLLQRS